MRQPLNWSTRGTRERESREHRAGRWELRCESRTNETRRSASEHGVGEGKVRYLVSAVAFRRWRASPLLSTNVLVACVALLSLELAPSGGKPTKLRSDHANVLGFLTLAAGGDVELDALALVKRLVAAALDVGEVDEHVVALLSRNEAEALLGVEELHGTCGHSILSSVLSLSV